MFVTRRLLLEDAAGKAGLLRGNEQTGHAADPTSRSPPGRSGSLSRSEVLPTCGRHGLCWYASQSSSGSSTPTSRWPSVRSSSSSLKKTAVSPQLTTTCEPGVWRGAQDEPEPGWQFELAVEG